MVARRLRTSFGFGCTLVLLALTPTSAGSAIERQRAEARPLEQPWFELRAPSPRPVLSRGADGFDDLEIDGFRKGFHREGSPDLPSKVLKIAIPFGAVPRLEVRPGMPRYFTGVRPRPVSRKSDRTHAADDAIYGGTELFPEELVSLGAIGILRDQRYVEVRVAPARYEPALRRVAWYPELVVKLHFEGPVTRSASPAPPDRHFEATYRRAFANYEQGRHFRREPVSRSAPSVAPSTQSSSGPGPRYRIRIQQDGVVRLGFAELSAAGFDSHLWSRLVLETSEIQIPLHIEDDGDNVIESGEWLQFYAEAADREDRVEMFGTDRFFSRDFTDESIYFLSVAGADQPMMSERSVLPSNGTVESSFVESSRFEADEVFRPLGGVDPWVASPLIEETEFRDVVFALPGLHGTTLPIDVRVEVRGRSVCASVNPDHITRVTVENGSAEILASDDVATDGESMYQHTLAWTYPGSGAELSDPMTVKLTSLDIPGVCRNDVYLNWAELDYRRSFVADGDALEFTWPDGDAEFEITGFDTAPEVYEITERFSGSDVVDAERLIDVQVTAGANFTARFEISQDPNLVDGTPRRFAVYGVNALQTPSGGNLTADTVSDLRNTANQADWLVIAHSNVLDQTADACSGPAPTGCLTALIAHRASAAGGGLTTKVADIQDVYDEFYGGRPGPLAIREFLRWVMSNEIGEGWASPKPAFVLLLGDGSYDYKSGPTFGNLIPTQIVLNLEPELQYYATETYMAAVVGDDFTPDLTIGRIPVRSTGEANTVLHKILEYETNPPTGNWRQRFLAVSDHGHGIPNPQFVQTNDDSLVLATDPGYLSTHLDYWDDYAGNQDDVMRQDIKDVMNGADVQANGASIVQYVGHGNFQVWSDDEFWDEDKVSPDSLDLLNGFKLPVMLAHNCLTGGFHFTFRDNLKIDRTVAEGWLKQDAGGAVAVWSPTGLSFNFISDLAAQTFWGTTFGQQKERVLGVAVMETLTELCTETQSLDACLFYSLQGDPATVMQLPTVGRPGSPQVISGNSVVDLSWTASSGSTTPGTIEYDVYRTTLLGGAYSKINGSGHTTTTFSDTDVSNGQFYYYYVVARDTAGFLSAWSNFNSDCISSGPDCLKGAPINLNPPSVPTGLGLTDPGNGSSMDVDWNDNPEPDIDYYTVEYGTASGVYTFSVDAPASSATIDGLTPEQVYFVAVSATNTSALTSSTSPESSLAPRFAPGLAIPDFIDDLTVTYNFPADDAILSWSESGENVWGQPSSPLRYDVYRGTDADFSNAGLSLLGSCNAPCTGYVDEDVVSSATNYHYRVQVVDGVGELSGLGSELPKSIVNLDVEPSVTPGDVTLTWPAVTETMDGLPTEIDHYLVYYSATEFNRDDIENMVGGILGPVMTTATTVDLLPPASESYYSVLAVDVRGQISPY